MAEETVDVVERRLGRSPRHVTAQLQLAGRHDLERVVGDVTRQAAALGLEASVPWLLCAYGTAARDVLELATQDPALARPIVDGLPYLLAEVVYACRFEQVQHIDDLVERRTFLAFVDWHHGLQSLETMSMIMARALHWSDVQRVSEVARFRHRVQELFGAEYGIAVELRAARAALHTGGGSG
jgi:glycerol-3-phosphate dehydrogenase